MNVGRKQNKQRLLVISVSRVLIAVCVGLSFLATVVPAGFSSSPQPMLHCCVGKPGHEAGSCATGLVKSAKSQFVTSASLFHDPESTSEFSLAVVAGAGTREHCHDAAAGTPTSTDTVFAGHETKLKPAELKPAEPESQPLIFENGAVPTAESGLTSLHAVSQRCKEDCGACSTSVTRRAREQTTLSSAATPHIPSVRRLPATNDLQVRPTNRKWSPLRPRAPPA